MKKLLLFLGLLTCTSLQAEPLKQVFNTFTNKPDYITRVDTNTIIPGTGVTITCTNGACTVNSTGGGGGGSVIETIFGTVESSPTLTIRGRTGDFTGIVTGSTMTIVLDPATTNYIHNQQTAQATTAFNVSSATVTHLFTTNATLNSNGTSPSLVDTGSNTLVFQAATNANNGQFAFQNVNRSQTNVTGGSSTGGMFFFTNSKMNLGAFGVDDGGNGSQGKWSFSPDGFTVTNETVIDNLGLREVHSISNPGFFASASSMTIMGATGLAVNNLTANNYVKTDNNKILVSQAPPIPSSDLPTNINYLDLNQTITGIKTHSSSFTVTAGSSLTGGTTFDSLNASSITLNATASIAGRVMTSSYTMIFQNSSNDASGSNKGQFIFRNADLSEVKLSGGDNTVGFYVFADSGLAKGGWGIDNSGPVGASPGKFTFSPDGFVTTNETIIDINGLREAHAISNPGFFASTSSMTIIGASGFGGAGLAACGDGTHALSWSAGQFGCQVVTGSGGASTLAITTGTVGGWVGVVTASPTAVVNFDQSQFSGTLQGAATAFMTLRSGISSVVGNFTLGSTSTVVLADATGGAITVTLPTAVGITGKVYTVKRINSGANAVTIGTTSSQTIDGATTAVLIQQYTSLDMISDGANWQIE